MDKDNGIVVFARHPTPGRVKTRLAAGVGNDGAARFYKHCAEKVIQECLKYVYDIANLSVKYG